MSFIKTIILPSLLAGILFFLGWPTNGFPLLLFVAFVPLLWIEEHVRTQTTNNKSLKVFFSAYTAFVIWNFTTTGWLYYASLFGMLFAVLVNALLMSMVFLIFHHVAKRTTSKIFWPFLTEISDQPTRLWVI